MALTTGNWSIAGATATGTTGKVKENTYIMGRDKVAHLKLTMAASGWPVAGLNMPNHASIGFKRDITMYLMPPRTSTSLLASFAVSFALSSTGNQLMKCFKTIECSGAGSAIVSCTKVLSAAQTFYVTAYGW